VAEVIASQLGRELGVSATIDKDLSEHRAQRDPLLNVISVMGGGVSVDYEDAP
jgi:hypothetical protein